MRKILEACPTCGSELVVSEVTCTVCDTTVRSRYAPCPFCRLAPEDLAFMLLFVKSRGNVKDMERELGVSYWTIRGRLNEIISAMGLGGEDGEAADAPPDVEPPAPRRGRPPAERQAVLDRLRAGEISAEEAARLISKQ